MILSSIILSIIFCQIISVSTSAIPQSGSEQSAIQALEPEKPIANILFEYATTEVGTHKIHNSRATWNDARNICLDENAQLAVIDTAAEEAMLLKHMKANNMVNLWLGVHDLFGNKQWTTITGDRLFTSQRYVHWSPGEPNNAGNGEHCGVLYQSGMNDLSCDWAIDGFVCERISHDFPTFVIS